MLATTTFAPMESPTKSVTIRLMTDALLPTAAMAWADANFPATAVSAELKSCCNIPDNAIGSARPHNLVNIGPLSISIECLLSFVMNYPFGYIVSMFMLFWLRA